VERSSQTYRRENVIRTQSSFLFTIVNSTSVHKIVTYLELYHPGIAWIRDWQSVVCKLHGFVFRNGYTAACWKIRFIIAAKANAVATKSDIFSAGIQQSFPLRDYTDVRIAIKMFWRGRNKLPAGLFRSIFFSCLYIDFFAYWFCEQFVKSVIYILKNILNIIYSIL